MKPLHLPICFLALLCATPIPASSESGPPLQLALPYRAAASVKDFWISEKLDGVRAYWNGQRFLSRQGHIITAPAWFLAVLPPVALDGELWMGRGQFEALSAAVRRQQPDEEEWRRIRYMVFDLPSAIGPFSTRLEQLLSITEKSGAAWLQAVDQIRVANREELMHRYRQVLDGGGEGLMLHRADAHYRAGRADSLQKMKPFDDGEALVTGYQPGQGKFVGMTGALLLETRDGRRFKVGSGLTDELRRSPPPVGSRITYRHSGLTGQGLPRHPRFHRIFDPL